MVGSPDMDSRVLGAVVPVVVRLIAGTIHTSAVVRELFRIT